MFLALPMLCVAYVMQDGAQIGWDGNIWLKIPVDKPPNIQLNWLLLIFLLKSLWAAGIGVLLYALLALIHHGVDFAVLQTISVLLLALGIFGIFGKSQFPQLQLMSPYWFYCSLVWALFLSAMAEQFDKAVTSTNGT